MSFVSQDLKIISRIAPERITMTVRGEIDITTAPEFRHAMTDHLWHGPATTLHVDLSGVSFMDSSGVQAMLAVQRTARLMGGGLIVTRTSPHVYRLLSLMGVAARFVGETQATTTANNQQVGRAPSPPVVR